MVFSVITAVYDALAGDSFLSASWQNARDIAANIRPLMGGAAIPCTERQMAAKPRGYGEQHGHNF